MSKRTGTVALTIWMLVLRGTASASEYQQPEAATLRVLVLNQARVPTEVLGAAEEDAAAIYAAAGVRVVWRDPADGGAEQNSPFDVAVKIAGAMKSSMRPRGVEDMTLGFAAVKAESEGRRGRLVWVFFNEVEIHAGRHNMMPSRLCGLVMAHEIGHLLLPSGHSKQGLMRAG
ncbi:MAG TPA: hypothetical protein VFZ98_07910, partial [Vicinamibacterales bacterium]